MPGNQSGFFFRPFSSGGGSGGGYIGDAWVKSTSITTAGFGTPTSVEVYTRRVGDTLEMRGNFLCGTTTGTPALINIPGGLTIDTTKISTATNVSHVGFSFNSPPGAAANIYSDNRAPILFFDGSDTDAVYFAWQLGGSDFDKVNGDTLWSVSHLVAFHFSVPILGWAANSTVTTTNLTNWVAYTPTFTGFGTPTSITFYSRRVGDTLEVKGKFTSGTVTGVPSVITIGFNGVDQAVTVDTTKVPTTSVVGVATVAGQSTTVFGWYILSPATSIASVIMSTQTSTINATTANTNVNAMVANTQLCQVSFSVPIVGWSA